MKLLSAQHNSNSQSTAYNYYSIYLHNHKSSMIILPTGILPSCRQDTTIVNPTQTQNRERMLWQSLHAQSLSANTLDKAWAISVPTHPSSALFQMESQCFMFPTTSIWPGSEPQLKTFVRNISCPIRPKSNTKIIVTPGFQLEKAQEINLPQNKRVYFQRKLEAGKVDGT